MSSGWRRFGMTADEARTRALRIKLVLSDSDGVLTDAGVYYSDAGEAMKRFSLRDGMGVERLREAAIESGIITGEASPCVLRRAEKLQLRFVYLGIKDKRAQLEEILATHSLGLGEIAFIGDDWNDLGLLRALSKQGLAGAPADAITEVAEAAHFVTKSFGGHGAFRDFAEWILELRSVPAAFALGAEAAPSSDLFASPFHGVLDRGRKGML